MTTENSNNDFERVYVVFSLNTENQTTPIIYTKNLEEALEKAEKFLTLRMPDPDFSFYTERRSDRVILYSRPKNLPLTHDSVTEVAYVHEVYQSPDWDLEENPESESYDSELDD
jgi:hypothetical protein